VNGPFSHSASGNRKFYLLVAAFLLVAVLSGLLSARRGKSSVEQWKAEMRAKGEKFTIAELLAGHIPAKTNRLDELVRLGKLLGASGKALGAIEHFRYLSNGVAEAAWMRPKLGLSAAAPGATVGRGHPSATVPFEWEDLAAELAAMETTLAEVHALLAVPDRDTGWNYDQRSSMPRCYTEKRNLAHWLALANTHALHERQPAQAVRHLLAMLQLVAWHDEDFSIIGQMVRASVGGLALHSTWAAAQAPGVTEAQLAELQARWGRLLVLPGFARALEFERAGIDALILRARAGEEMLGTMFGGSSGSFANRAVTVAWRAFAAEGDELFYLQAMQDQIDIARKEARLRSTVATQPERAAFAAKVAPLATGSIYRLPLSRMALPSFANASKNLLRYETRRELTIAALAIERHRRKHGRPPAKLVDLVPAFLSAVPVDWMDGNPLRYRVNADGTFTLWSIGEDLKDDGGDGSDAAPATRTTDIWDRKDVLWPRPPP
jgi:hypothetical protein